LKKTLRPAGYEVLEASDGRTGLELLASQTIDCVLLDLGMPEMGGEEVLTILQQQGSQTPVIVISADIQETTNQRCLSLGAFAVLHKIVNPNELLQTVKLAIAQQAGESL
jgi:CheY-like chemotaxis protein